MNILEMRNSGPHIEYLHEQSHVTRRPWVGPR